MDENQSRLHGSPKFYTPSGHRHRRRRPIVDIEREPRHEVHRIHDSLDDFVDSLETIRVTPEAPWDEAGNALLQNWVDVARKEANLHRKKGYFFKRLYKVFGILNIFTAALVFFFTNLHFRDEEMHTTTITVVSFLNLIISNLNTFLGYGPKYQLEFEFEGKFLKFAIDLEEILSTQTEFRPPKDRVLAENKEKIGNLITHAPET